MYALNRHRPNDGRCLSLDGKTSQIYLSKFLFCNIFFIRPIATRAIKRSVCLKLSALDDRGTSPSHRETDARIRARAKLFPAISLTEWTWWTWWTKGREGKKELLYGEERPYRLVSSSFLSIAIARGISTREIAYSGMERRSTFIYVCPIDSLLYGARDVYVGRQMPKRAKLLLVLPA